MKPAELDLEGAAGVVPGWSIDRRVPMALMIAGLLQFGALCAGGAVLLSTVSDHTRRISAIEESRTIRHDAEGQTLASLQIEIAKIAERLDVILSLQRERAAGRAPG